MEGTDTEPYTEAQYAALIDATLQLVGYYPELRMQRIVGHSDVAPGRKTDPGPAFDWHKYRTALDTGDAQ